MQESFFYQGVERPLWRGFYFVQSAEPRGARHHRHTELCVVDHPGSVGTTTHVRAKLCWGDSECDGTPHYLPYDGGQGPSAASILDRAEIINSTALANYLEFHHNVSVGVCVMGERNTRRIST